MEPDQIEYQACLRYIEAEEQLIPALWNSFRRYPKRTQRWNLIDPDHLGEVWIRAVYGDKDAIAVLAIEKQALECAIQLRFNTTLCGHTERCPIAYLAEYDITASEKLIDRCTDTMIDPTSGQLWISDFGLRPAEEVLFRILCTQGINAKLLAIYRLLNVAHRRGDFSAFFIKGGRQALTIEP